MARHRGSQRDSHFGTGCAGTYSRYLCVDVLYYPSSWTLGRFSVMFLDTRCAHVEIQNLTANRWNCRCGVFILSHSSLLRRTCSCTMQAPYRIFRAWHHILVAMLIFSSRNEHKYCNWPMHWSMYPVLS